jgi:hypothetical protein
VGFAALSPPYKKFKRETKDVMAGTLCVKTALRAWCPAMTRDERLRIFASAVRCLRIETIRGHVSRQIFHAKEIGFQGLTKLHESVRRSCLTFVSVTTNCATVSLNKGAF